MRFLIPLTLAAVAALAGCTTPVETRNAISEMNRLCEAEAGYTVVQPALWRGPVRLSEQSEPCAATGPQELCRKYPALALISQSGDSMVIESNSGGVLKSWIRYFSSETGALVAEHKNFHAYGENSLLADDRMKQTRCSAIQIRRTRVVTGA